MALIFNPFDGHLAQHPDYSAEFEKLNKIYFSPTTVKNSNYFAALREEVRCNTTAGSFTVTLPAMTAENQGESIKIVDFVGIDALTGFGQNPLTVVGSSGATIMNSADLSIDIGSTRLTLTYNHSDTDWKISDVDSPMYNNLDWSSILNKPTYVTTSSIELELTGSDGNYAIEGNLVDKGVLLQNLSDSLQTSIGLADSAVQPTGLTAILNKLNALESFYNIIATGGTVTEITDGGVDYRVHTFTASGTFEVTSTPANAETVVVEYLVVAGGGGGGGHDLNDKGGGGGGAGGLLIGTTTLNTAQAYTVVVGGGGAGGAAGPNKGATGSNSVALSLTADGGGGGAGGAPDGGLAIHDGLNGGSGGGATRGGDGGSATSGQGSDGANVPDSAGYDGGGGGGGKSAAGANGGSSGAGGNGGAGEAWNGITYAGGGGGGAYSGSGGSGGAGGGGAGGDVNTDGVAGTANLGGGGGGAGGGVNAVRAGANGGSGIVIIRYQILI